MLADILQGTRDFGGKTQVYTAVIGQHDIVDAQYHTEDIPLTNRNTNILGPGVHPGFEALSENAGKDMMVAVVGNLMKDIYGNQVSSNPAVKGVFGGAAADVQNLRSYEATQNAATKSKEERDAAHEQHATEYDPDEDKLPYGAEKLGQASNILDVDTRFGRINMTPALQLWSRGTDPSGVVSGLMGENSRDR